MLLARHVAGGGLYICRTEREINYARVSRSRSMSLFINTSCMHVYILSRANRRRERYRDRNELFREIIVTAVRVNCVLTPRILRVTMTNAGPVLFLRNRVLERATLYVSSDSICCPRKSRINRRFSVHPITIWRVACRATH